MAFWDWFPGSKSAGERRSSQLMDPHQMWIDWMRGAVPEGVVDVSAVTALTISAVYACCRIRSMSIASLQLGLFRRSKGGSVEEINDGPEWEKVCVEPNSLYSSFSWRGACQMRKDLHGNSFNRLYFDGTNVPTAGRIRKIELIRQPVTPMLHKGELFYEITHDDGKRETLAGYEVLHLKGLTEDGLVSRSLIDVAKKKLGAAMSADAFGLDVWKSGGVLKGFVESPHILTDKQKTDLKDSVLSVMRNYQQTGGIGLLQNGIKFNKVGISPQEAQLLEFSKYINTEVSRYYGVPLHMISELDRATFSNIEHQGIEFAQHTVRPEVKGWESELDRRILRPKDRGKLFFRFNLESLLRADTKSRAEFYAKMFSIGALCPDDIRALENMNAIPGGKGKLYYRPANMVPIGAKAANGNGSHDNTGNTDSTGNSTTDNTDTQHATTEG